jgi:phytoene dehydrogenase-like protein
LSGAVKHAELATPKTIQRYTLNPGGTAYGFAQTPSQSLFDRQVESPLPNLHFASAWTFPGGGFTKGFLGTSERDVATARLAIQDVE